MTEVQALFDFPYDLAYDPLPTLEALDTPQLSVGRPDLSVGHTSAETFPRNDFRRRGQIRPRDFPAHATSVRAN